MPWWPRYHAKLAVQERLIELRLVELLDTVHKHPGLQPLHTPTAALLNVGEWATRANLLGVRPDPPVDTAATDAATGAVAHSADHIHGARPLGSMGAPPEPAAENSVARGSGGAGESPDNSIAAAPPRLSDAGVDGAPASHDAAAAAADAAQAFDVPQRQEAAAAGGDITLPPAQKDGSGGAADIAASMFATGSHGVPTHSRQPEPAVHLAADVAHTNGAQQHHGAAAGPGSEKPDGLHYAQDGLAHLQPDIAAGATNAGPVGTDTTGAAGADSAMMDFE